MVPPTAPSLFPLALTRMTEVIFFTLWCCLDCLLSDTVQILIQEHTLIFPTSVSRLISTRQHACNRFVLISELTVLKKETSQVESQRPFPGSKKLYTGRLGDPDQQRCPWRCSQCFPIQCVAGVESLPASALTVCVSKRT